MTRFEESVAMITVFVGMLAVLFMLVLHMTVVNRVDHLRIRVDTLERAVQAAPECPTPE